MRSFCKELLFPNEFGYTSLTFPRVLCWTSLYCHYHLCLAAMSLPMRGRTDRYKDIWSGLRLCFKRNKRLPKIILSTLLENVLTNFDVNFPFCQCESSTFSSRADIVCTRRRQYYSKRVCEYWCDLRLHWPETFHNLS